MQMVQFGFLWNVVCQQLLGALCPKQTDSSSKMTRFISPITFLSMTLSSQRKPGLWVLFLDSSEYLSLFIWCQILIAQDAFLGGIVDLSPLDIDASRLPTVAMLHVSWWSKWSLAMLTSNCLQLDDRLLIIHAVSTVHPLMLCQGFH